MKRIEDAKKKVKEAETNKSGKEAQQASQMADNALKDALDAKRQAADSMARITDEAFLKDARTVFADIEAKCKEAEELAKAIRDKKDEVKRQNSFFGRLRSVGETILED